MLEILTPCRDQSHGEAECAIRCDNIGEPVWNEFLGGWFHVEQLLMPQERTARAHADLHDHADRERRAAEARIRAKTAAMEGEIRRTTGGFLDLVLNGGSFDIYRAEPSDPGTTMPPQLDP